MQEKDEEIGRHPFLDTGKCQVWPRKPSPSVKGLVCPISIILYHCKRTVKLGAYFLGKLSLLGLYKQNDVEVDFLKTPL